METGWRGFLEVILAGCAIDADTDHIGRREAGAFGSAHAAEHGVVVHAADDQVFRAAGQLDQRRVGGVHAARYVEGFQCGEEDVILGHAGLLQGIDRTVGALLAGVEFVVGVDHRVGVFPVPVTLFRFSDHRGTLLLADFERGHAQVRHVFHELAVGIDKTVVDGNHFQVVDLGFGHDGRAEGYVRRADHEALGTVGSKAVDGRQGFLAIRHGDFDQFKALILGGFLGVGLATREETKGGAAESLSEEDELKLLTKAAKQRKDSADIYQQQNREDLLAVELAELEIISEFLPKQLSEEELEAELKKIIAEAGAEGPKDMGKVMGVATKELAGLADGKVVSATVKALLG